MDERWLPVVGYEGVYEVSDLGRVRRIGRARGATPGRILRPSLNRRDGYLRVVLASGDVQTSVLVHRLVALAHIGPPPPPAHEVNHKDRDRSNAAASNLEWVDRSGNIRHAMANGAHRLTGEQKPHHKLTWPQVDAIRSSSDTSRALARLYGVHHKTICDIRAGRKWRLQTIAETLR